MHHYHSTAHEGLRDSLSPGTDAVLAMALVVVLAPVAALVLLSEPAVTLGLVAGALLGHVGRE